MTVAKVANVYPKSQETKGWKTIKYFSFEDKSYVKAKNMDNLAKLILVKCK